MTNTELGAWNQGFTNCYAAARDWMKNNPGVTKDRLATAIQANVQEAFPELSAEMLPYRVGTIVDTVWRS